MKRCLIIFAKEPKADEVKTRLLKHLSEFQCLDLYKAFLKDTIAIAKSIQCEEKILAYESNAKGPVYLRRIAGSFRFYKQEGKNLGQRMHNAFKFAKKNEDYKIIIIGSDSPSLPLSFIEQAFRRLTRSDLVIGPSCDGGYYLIGLKKPCPDLFKGIKWSSNRVLSETIKKARTFKKRISILDKWYDVDDPKALAHLAQDLKKDEYKNSAKWTRKFLKI